MIWLCPKTQNREKHCGWAYSHKLGCFSSRGSPWSTSALFRGEGSKIEEKVLTDWYKKRGLSKIAKKVMTYFMDGPQPVLLKLALPLFWVLIFLDCVQLQAASKNCIFVVGYLLSFQLLCTRELSLVSQQSWSLSSVRFKYKPGYKPCDLL